jgi:hypothetical protein
MIGGMAGSESDMSEAKERSEDQAERKRVELKFRIR